MTSPIERRSVRFLGKVQGVGFRMTCRAVASKMGLTGWVRNEPDRSVLMEIQGPPAAIDTCLGRIQAETIGRVDDRQEEPLSALSEESGFEIRH